MAFNEMSMNNNYVDARTPEEIANAPKGVITYASSMNKDTLKEREKWEDDFDNLKIKYQTSKGIVLDDITLLDDETTDTIKAFISTLIQQARKEEIEFGRLSVLHDFDAVCQTDAFVGFSEDEWKTIKRFFEFNKVISGWDK